MAESRAFVVGLGSPHGDDRFGWEAAARLTSEMEGVSVASVSDPLAVADVSSGCDLLVIVDACRGAGPPGSIHRIAWPDARLPMTASTSSHGLGLAEALALAAALNRLPSRVVVLAVEGEQASGDSLSEPVLAALPEIVARVRAEIATAAAAAFG